MWGTQRLSDEGTQRGTQRFTARRLSAPECATYLAGTGGPGRSRGRSFDDILERAGGHFKAKIASHRSYLYLIIDRDRSSTMPESTGKADFLHDLKKCALQGRNTHVFRSGARKVPDGELAKANSKQSSTRRS
jgi:hypothetical protein